MNERKESLKIQAEYFLKNKTKVHIEKYGRRWYNGLIVSVDDLKIVLFDHKSKTKMPILFFDIKELEPYVQGGKYEN
jgi:hypothetical protein